MSTPGKLIVHYLEKSRAQRVLWLLEELHLPYELKYYKRDPVTSLAPPELRKVHPVGKSPIIEDEGRVIIESSLIIQHIIDKYGKGKFGVKTEHEKQKLQLHYYHCEGSFFPALLVLVIANKIKSPSAAPFFLRPITNLIGNKIADYPKQDLERELGFLESEVQDSNGYFVSKDDITGADFMYYFPLFELRDQGSEYFPASKYPGLHAWLDKVAKREGFIRAEKIDKYLEKSGGILPSEGDI